MSNHDVVYLSKMAPRREAKANMVDIGPHVSKSYTPTAHGSFGRYFKTKCMQKPLFLPCPMFLVGEHSQHWQTLDPQGA